MAALAEAEEASVRLLRSAEMPTWFVLILMAIMAASYCTVGVVPFGVTLWLHAPLALLAGGHFLVVPHRPRLREPLARSGTYAAGVLLVSLVLQTARLWPLHEWWQIALKWIALSCALTFLWNRIRRAEMTNRIKDANERPF